MNMDQAWLLLTVSVAIVFLPGLSRILRVPAIILEILFGVLLGKSLLGLNPEGQWFSFLAQLGFLLLMFHAGMEIDFGVLKRQSRWQLMLQLLLFALTFGLSSLAAAFLGMNFFVAFILSTTSLGLVVPLLKETGISRTSLGQAALIAATLADFLTLLGITLFVMLHEHGFGWQVLGPIPLLLGFGLLMKAGKLWVWWHPQSASRLLATGDPQEMGVRLSMALLFLFVAFSEMVHLEPVLGAFLGGALLSLIFREKEGLETKLSGIGFGFLVPIFFIHVGMQFDLTNVLSLKQLSLTAKLLACAIMVKLLPSLLFTFNGVTLKAALNVGILLSSRLSLIIVAASIGRESGFITVAEKDAIVLLAILTCFLCPTIFKLFSAAGDPGGPESRHPAGAGAGRGWMR